MGQCGLHEQPSTACLDLTITWEIAVPWGGASVLMLGAAVGARVGGFSQSSFASNRFSGADPVLGQGVPCPTGALGMSSTGGGLE